MATYSTDRRTSYSNGTEDRKTHRGRDLTQAEIGPIEVQWTEVRIGRDGNQERFFLRGTRTSVGWQFQERSTWEVSWYPVAAGLLHRCTKRAQEVLMEAAAASVPPPRRDPPEVGNLHDNEAVVVAARARLAAGDAADAVYMLTFLQDHVLASPDPKSKRLIPEILGLLKEATAAARKGVSSGGIRTGWEPRRRTSARKIGNGVGRAARGRHEPDDHQLKSHLLNATALVTMLTYAVGLLVHEIVVVLPTLAASPITANVLAASALGVTLFVIRSRSG